MISLAVVGLYTNHVILFVEVENVHVVCGSFVSYNPVVTIENCVIPTISVVKIDEPAPNELVLVIPIIIWVIAVPYCPDVMVDVDRLETVMSEAVMGDPMRLETVMVEPIRLEKVRLETVMVEAVMVDPMRLETVMVDPVRLETVMVEAMIEDTARVDPVMDDPEMVEKLIAAMVAVEAYTVEMFAVEQLSNAVKRVLVLMVDPDREET